MMKHRESTNLNRSNLKKYYNPAKNLYQSTDKLKKIQTHHSAERLTFNRSMSSRTRLSERTKTVKISKEEASLDKK